MTCARTRVAIGALLLVGNAGCGLMSPRFPRDCHLGDPVAPGAQRKPVPADLSSLKLYRNTYAVDRVGPYEQHFTIWYHDNDPAYAEVRARFDASGHVHIDIDHGMWGGIGSPPQTPKRAPPEVAELERALENEAQDRCPDARGWVFQYDGAYREVDLVELVPSNARVGWHGRVTLAADQGLTRALPQVPDAMTGFGILEVHEPAQWIDYAPPAGSVGTVLLTDRLMRENGAPPVGSPEADLTARALEAARRLAGGVASPPLTTVVASQGDTLLPRDLRQRLRVAMTFYARVRDPLKTEQAQLALAVPLETRALAREASTGETTGVVGGIHVKMRATLAPRAAPPDDTGGKEVPFEATLTLHVEDDRGHTFDRSYPARGQVLVDGGVVVAPGGLVLPGTSGPSPEMDALHGELPGRGPYGSVDFYLDAGVGDDPREL